MLIGLTGRARNGKSTVATAIIDRAHEQNLRTRVYDIGGLVRYYCVENGLLPDVARSAMTAAQLETLVHIGKAKRDEDPDYWIRDVELYYQRNPDTVLIVPNVRYKNERDMVVRNGGSLVKVLSVNPDGSPYVSRDRDPNHPSETELLNIAAHYYLTAVVGDSELLRRQAVTLFDYLRNPGAAQPTVQFDTEFIGVPV